MTQRGERARPFAAEGLCPHTRRRVSLGCYATAEEAALAVARNHAAVDDGDAAAEWIGAGGSASTAYEGEYSDYDSYGEDDEEEEEEVVEVVKPPPRGRRATRSGAGRRSRSCATRTARTAGRPAAGRRARRGTRGARRWVDAAGEPDDDEVDDDEMEVFEVEAEEVEAEEVETVEAVTPESRLLVGREWSEERVPIWNPHARKSSPAWPRRFGATWPRTSRVTQGYEVYEGQDGGSLSRREAQEAKNAKRPNKWKSAIQEAERGEFPADVPALLAACQLPASYAAQFVEDGYTNVPWMLTLADDHLRQIARDVGMMKASARAKRGERAGRGALRAGGGRSARRAGAACGCGRVEP